MKPRLFTILILLSFLTANGQEIFLDKISQDTCLFIGGIKSEKNDMLKVFEDSKITFKNSEDLEQVGLLIGKEFTNKLFKSGLCFELNGYEPFWNAIIFKDEINIYIPEKDNREDYKINLYTNEESSDPIFFAMFSSKCGNIFGTINNIGSGTKDKCHVCEYLIPEYEDSIYEVYINIYGKIYKGCGTIRQYETKN